MGGKKTERKEIPTEIRELIVKLRSEKKSLGEIAAIVHKPRSSIQTVLRNWAVTGSINVKPRTGRPSALTNREQRAVINRIKAEPKTSAVQIAQEISADYGKTVHAECIRRVLRKNNYHGRIVRRKPYISEINEKKRLEFAHKYENEDVSFWERVLFTDETKINLYQNEGCRQVWRKTNTALNKENLQPTVKHGGESVLLWGCISASGVGNIAFIDGIMDRFKYVDILKANLQDSVCKLKLDRSWVFQQDNDPKHTSCLAKE